MSKFKTKPQSASKKWKSKKLGKNEYWTPTLLGGKNRKNGYENRIY